MTKAALKPCPFCGPQDHYSKGPHVLNNPQLGGYYVLYPCCMSQIGIARTKDEAIEKANRRPTEQALVEALKQCVSEMNAFVANSQIDVKDPRHQKATWYKRIEKAKKALEMAGGE